ncbi:MAG: hypothetical protein QG556_852 [Pseudomonadota bacterium]|nr:hypothetical protein [Pseudomonadota bacterium]
MSIIIAILSYLGAMKEIDLIIKEKLNKLKITDARYLQEFEQLSNIGFSEQQANQLI